MGERWVSPGTYVAARHGGVFTVQARAHGIGDGGARLVNPTWLPAEPDMVGVSPGEGPGVEITVLRPGRSELVVSEGETVARLTLEAVQQGAAWRVTISQ